MDGQDPDPFSFREELSLFLPPWLVRLLGPYPDEVGLLPVVLKWLVVVGIPTLAWFNCVERLIPEQQKTEWALSLLLFSACGLVVGLTLLRQLDHRD